MFLKEYDYLLFDADETLFDYDRAEAMALKTVFLSHGFKYSDKVRDIYREINKEMWQNFENGSIFKEEMQSMRFMRLFGELGIMADARAFNEEYITELGKGAFLIDGALDICKSMFKKSKKLYIITNGILKVQKARLEISAIKPFISGIFVSEEVGFQKPHQSYFEYVLSHISCADRAKALIIGDSLTADIAGGYRAGIDTCWFNRLNAKSGGILAPVYEIHALRELESIIA